MMALSLSDMVLGLLTTVSSLVVESASDNKQQQINLTGDVKVAVEGQQVAGNKDVFRGEKAQMGRSAESIGSPPQQVSATQKNSELAARGNHSSAKADSKNLSSQNQGPSFADGHSSASAHRVPLQTQIVVGQPVEGQRHGSSRHSSSSTSSSRDGSEGVSSSPVSGASYGMRGGEGSSSSSGGVSLGGSARTASATYESEASPSSIESKVRSGSTSPLTPSATRSDLEALAKGMDRPSFEGPKMSGQSKSVESIPQAKMSQPKSIDKTAVREFERPAVKEADKSVPAEGSKAVEKQANNDRESSLSHTPVLQSAPKQAVPRSDLLSQQPSVTQYPERESGLVAITHDLESREPVQKAAPLPPKAGTPPPPKAGTPPPPKAGTPPPPKAGTPPPPKADAGGERKGKEADKKVAPPASRSIVNEPKTPQKAAEAGQKGAAPSASLVKGAGSSAEVQQAAKELGFDLNKSYKDLAEATQALTAMVKRKSYTLQNKLEGILEKYLENIDEDADLEQILAQDSEYTQASAEIKAIDAYQEQIKEALIKKHARTIELDEKDVQAAQALGFDLNTSYKDLGEATQALTAMVKRKSYIFQNKMEGILEKYLENIDEDADLEQILAQDSEYAKASAEIKAIDAYQEQVKEALTKKHALAAQKKVKKSNAVDGEDFVAELKRLQGENQPAQQLSPDELKKEIRELGMKVRAVEAEAAAIYATDSERGAVLSREAKEMKELKLQREAELNKLQAQKASTDNVQRTALRKGPTPEQLEKQTQEVQKFTSSYPVAVPFLDLLELNEKVNFMKGKIAIDYLANKFYQQKEDQKRPEKVQTKQLSIVSTLSLLTPEQEDEFLTYIGSLKENNPSAQSKSRLAALRNIKNYSLLKDFKVPNWREDLERLVTGSVPNANAAEPAKKTGQESDQDQDRAQAQPTRGPEAIKGDKDKMEKAASKLNKNFGKGPSKMVLKSRGERDDDTK